MINIINYNLLTKKQLYFTHSQYSDGRLSMADFIRMIVIGIVVITQTATIWADPAALLFDTADHGEPSTDVTELSPWKRISLDPEYGGIWVVTGDVDGDGAVDVVSSRNVNANDVHYTSTAVAQRLDGSVIWRWGDPTVGRREWHHDVATQIYDWDGDGSNEVILLTKGAIVELDGTTGKERRRITIPEEATDCLVFCNLSGNSHPSDVIVKDRYHSIYAYNHKGDMLWTVSDPGGYRTSHQPRPYDLDKDGRDEILAGYAMLNSDGSLRWTVSSEKTDIGKGHLDCARVLQSGDTPEDWRFIMTYCGANALSCVDGNGQTIWELNDFHFESINIGTIFPDRPSPQILVDIDHVPRGESPVWVIDADGNHLARLTSDYCRHHKLYDWNGDGVAEILLANARGIFDSTGYRIYTFDCDGPGVAMQLGDMNGDNIVDVAITTEKSVNIFVNHTGKKSISPLPLGCGVNFTFY